MAKKQTKHLGYRCIGPTITPVRIKNLQKKLKSDKKLQNVKEYFSILSGKTRLDILYLLREEKELCVCDIADILDTTVSAASHQLKVLRLAGLVKARRKAQVIFYSLSSDGKKELKNHLII